MTRPSSSRARRIATRWPRTVTSARRLSPGTYLPNVRTPLYLISNENDYNCPLPQALQLYQRLKLMGQETELVVYPGASHAMSRPSHLADRLRRLLVWFGRHFD